MTIFFVLFIAHWYASLFCQTFFLHRYAAHSMFTMSKKTEKVLFVLTWLTQGSSYLSPYAYSILHRLHHSYTDTEDDPHSPSYTKGLFALMWKTKNIYTGINIGKIEVEDKYKKNIPEWKSFNKFADSQVSRIGWGVIYFILYLFFATHWWMWLLFPITCLIGPVHGAIINYFAHKYGYTNFETPDTSKNFLPVDILMLGESYHNNHHKLLARPNFGVRWFEIDPVYPIIKLLSAVKIIKLNQT